jgi:hypothetical protein
LVGRWLSDVEECKLLLRELKASGKLDPVVEWYEAEQKRILYAEFAPVPVVEA